MNKAEYYNVTKYIKSILEMNFVLIDDIVTNFKSCKKYTINDSVKEYMYYVDKEPLYISPSFRNIKVKEEKNSANPQFLLFSAPGATGKSALAKYISYKYNGIYWNLAKIKLGNNSFVGTILSAVSAPEYSNFIKDLNESNVMLIIDAFDEAEIVSGRKMISSFISEINKCLDNKTNTSVIFLARTETAQFIASFCLENSISINHYEIGFFTEDKAHEFIKKNIETQRENVSQVTIDCIDEYYKKVSENINENERESFLGYAPVLEAMSKHIMSYNNAYIFSNILSSQNSCTDIIFNIMEDLLERERTKVKNSFISKCKEKHQEFLDWDNVYLKDEQIVRLVNYIVFGENKYNSYVIKGLPDQIVDEYQEVLDSFIPQHPFISNNLEKSNSKKDFTGPAFRDYTLATLILDENYSDLAEMYFEVSQGDLYIPSQIFFDCYTKITGNKVFSNHISYIYDSYRARTKANETPYIQCSEIQDDNKKAYSLVLGTEKASSKVHQDIVLEMKTVDNKVIFEQLLNASIDAPSLYVQIGKSGVDARIYNSSVVCKKIIWGTKNISLESYESGQNLLVSAEDATGDTPNFDIVGVANLSVSIPNISNYYRLVPYKYDFNDTSNVDATKLIYAMRCILMEFRTHKKDTLAKDAERINNVVVGNNKFKKEVLDYLKYKNIIYSYKHLYKVDTDNMQRVGISYSALARMQMDQLEEVYNEYIYWENNEYNC